jgi:hypothetical protein
MSNADYVRTDAELASQRAYEAREASRHLSIAQIVYRIVESKPPPDIITRTTSWRVVRKVNESAETWSRWFYRRVEAVDHLQEQMTCDRSAAARLGVNVHLTVGP